MQSTQFYKYATCIMVLLNLTILGFLFFRNPHGRKGSRAIDTLKLDRQQHAAFLISAKQHETLMKGLMEKQQVLLKPYFQQLINADGKVDEIQLLVTMHQLESQKIQSTYQHFKEVKAVLKEEQIADFELFMNRMLKKILLEKEKSPHPPKEF